MIRRTSPRHLSRAEPTAATTLDLVAGDFLTFARESDEDRRLLRWAVGVAALVHLVLFLLTFPQVVAVIEEPERAATVLIRPVRFTPPEDPPRDIPVRREHRVPVPDPTPELPEPIRLAAEINMPIALPEPMISGIPEAPPAIEEPTLLRVGGAVAAPRRLFAPQPRYPELARRAGEQGLVVVEAVIDESGAVTGVEILKGLRFGLNEAALEAVRRWRFEPATLNGRPVAVLYNLTINFQLR